MSSFNRPPRPFQFPAYDPQADYASPAARAGSGASFGASAEGFAPSSARSHAQQAARHEQQPLPDIYAPRGVYAHRDTYAPRHVYAPYDPAPVDPLDPHAPTHSWLDLELIPSWLRPFTIDANTRFTRTPDLYLRPREAEPQAVLAAPAVTETAPPPDISGRSWHFVLDPADDEPSAPDAAAPADADRMGAMVAGEPAAGAPDAGAWGAGELATGEPGMGLWGAGDDLAPVHPASGDEASGGDPLAVAISAGPAEAAMAPPGDAWDDTSAHSAASAPDAMAAFATLPEDGSSAGDASGALPVAFASDALPLAFAADALPLASAPGDLPVALETCDLPLALMSGDLPVALASSDLPVACPPEGTAADVTAAPAGEEIPMIEMPAADTPMDAPVMEMQTASAPFGQPGDADAPLALSGAVDPELAEASPAPHLQALTRLFVLGHAALPPAPAHDQDLFPSLATDGVLSADAFDGLAPAAAFAGADDGFTALPVAMIPADVADGMAFAPADIQHSADMSLCADGFLAAGATEQGAPFARADHDFTDQPADAAALIPADVVNGMATASAHTDLAADRDLTADGFRPADAFEMEAPAASFARADDGFTDLPEYAAATIPADVADGMALAPADTHHPAGASLSADGFLPADAVEMEAPAASFARADDGFTDLPEYAAATIPADVTDGIATAPADTGLDADTYHAEAMALAADGFLPADAPEEGAPFALSAPADEAVPPSIGAGEAPADLPPPDEPVQEPAPLPFAAGGAGSLWSPYQQLVTAHFLGGVAAFAPAVAADPVSPAPAAVAAPPAAFPPVAPAPAMAEAMAPQAYAEDEAGPAYDLPPLDLLREPPVVEPDYELSEEFLDQSSTTLQQVLRDFGVRGEVIDANPGPVVTLYEFEPAPGVKSSRVIGLSPDIARSMSAISARVAVVEGRNVIGIELPNRRRETVWLRELLASHEFAEARPKLGLCLGKTIGGVPVIADLARMPHLLVAGTTGSGKSVAINTMILSLLYRHTPEACRLIMIDPKMLELSIYEGIPHLLTPVVTDPKKAIIALKWAVKEMEERYKKMSRLAVRNIDGYNARVKEAAEKGEIITRNVQVGFDKETGEALFEEQEMDLTALPYIVVIVDEMADLMMVAGKEIEGAIQRLAQMARAAGIHLVMATQRPSVDVITGTIKANFPTRISFQVTSKIDSRTILGEMGAETLLGQGDMLFMAGGGRITRVHGPFVSDAEVEHVVAHLKAQGGPDYLDAVVLDEEAEADDEDEAVFDRSGLGEAGGDLYEQAVAIVMRDRKASTSYIQRRLQVGYNKAASLMERMETEGIVGPANHAGKREILTFSRPG